MIVGALLVAASIGACSSFEGGSTPTDDGGLTGDDASGVDQLVDDVAAGDASTAEAAVDAAPFPEMVVVDFSSKPFRIDREEVTAADWSAFVAGAADAGYLATPGCAYKNDSNGRRGPLDACLAGHGFAPNEPISCIDWCDADAYCRWRGKRLCGAIGGGPNGTDGESNAALSQWTQACIGGNFGADQYPYPPDAAVPDGGICNNSDAHRGKAAPVTDFPGCIGGVPGLHDMSGNVEEWVDSCSGTLNGPNDPCIIHGGSYDDTPAKCSFLQQKTRGDARLTRGFRCCKEL